MCSKEAPFEPEFSPRNIVKVVFFPLLFVLEISAERGEESSSSNSASRNLLSAQKALASFHVPKILSQHSG